MLKYSPAVLCSPQFLHRLLNIGHEERYIFLTYVKVLVRKAMQKQSLQNNSASVLLDLQKGKCLDQCSAIA